MTCLKPVGGCRKGSQVTGTISIVPRPGVVGAFVDLPDEMGGFVDARDLPRDPGEWPWPARRLRFEALQHTPGQVRLWPLSTGFHHDDTTPKVESGWRQGKLRYPVGSTVPVRVVDVFPLNHEYNIAAKLGMSSYLVTQIILAAKNRGES